MHDLTPCNKRNISDLTPSGHGDGLEDVEVCEPERDERKHDITTHASGISLRMSTRFPDTFSMTITARWPPSNGGSGIRLNMARNKNIWPSHQSKTTAPRRAACPVIRTAPTMPCGLDSVWSSVPMSIFKSSPKIASRALWAAARSGAQ